MALLTDHESINTRLDLMTVRQNDLIAINPVPVKNAGFKDEITPAGCSIVRSN